ncbi:MAG: hypothetical protein ACJ8AD_00405, partial [Gemmatimonadaceae bacterium]
AVRGAPSLDQLEASFSGGSVTAQSAYALGYRAVMELAALDPERGLTLFFRYWPESPSLDVAVRRAFGITLAGFEHDYQLRTRRRYGALALAADLSVVFVVMTILLMPFYIARRSRDRRRLAALLAADAAAEREGERALAALMAELGVGPADAGAPAGTSGGTPAEGSSEPPRNGTARRSKDGVSDDGTVA